MSEIAPTGTVQYICTTGLRRYMSPETRGGNHKKTYSLPTLDLGSDGHVSNQQTGHKQDQELRLGCKDGKNTFLTAFYPTLINNTNSSSHYHMYVSSSEKRTTRLGYACRLQPQSVAAFAGKPTLHKGKKQKKRLFSRGKGGVLGHTTWRRGSLQGLPWQASPPLTLDQPRVPCEPLRRRRGLWLLRSMPGKSPPAYRRV